MSTVTMEATIVLAPQKAREALMTTVAATRMFLYMNGREPSEDAVRLRFIREAVDLGCTEADLQWLIDAKLIDSDIVADWKAASHEHA
jgi:hypothetical protein